MNSSVAAPVSEGEVLAGRYRISRVIGVGGMGIVIAAEHLELGQRVALKFLHPAAANNRESAERFAREARAVVRIRSEHVTRVLDVGRLADGTPYMVMEYLDGRDLDSFLAERGTLSVEAAVDYVLQAGEAIAEAHALGIVHRDLKPANLFLTSRADGSALIKVLDFGISKWVPAGGDSAGLTSTTAVLGSPLYMSPEQIRSSKWVDARSDLWSLGVILYELLTGRHVFVAESITALVVSIVNDAPAPVRLFRPDVPPELDAVILRCLEKNAALRFQNMAELARALAPFAPHASLSVQRIGGVLTHPTLRTPMASVPLPPGPTPPSRKSAPTPPALIPPDASTSNAWGATSGVVLGSTRRLSAILLATLAIAVVLVGATIGGLLYDRAFSNRGRNMGTTATSQVAPVSTSRVPRPEDATVPLDSPRQAAAVQVSTSAPPSAPADSASSPPPLPDTRGVAPSAPERPPTPWSSASSRLPRNRTAPPVDPLKDQY